MNDCYRSLQMTIDFIKQYKDIALLTDYIKDVPIKFSLSKINLDKSKELYKLIQADGVLDYLHDYNPSTSPKIQTTCMCSKFMKLRETTFIQNVMFLFNGSESHWSIDGSVLPEAIQENIELINKKIAEYDQSLVLVPTPSSNWSVSRRLLSMGSTIPANMLTGDVSVSNATGGFSANSMDLDSIIS